MPNTRKSMFTRQKSIVIGVYLFLERVITINMSHICGVELLFELGDTKQTGDTLPNLAMGFVLLSPYQIFAKRDQTLNM